MEKAKLIVAVLASTLSMAPLVANAQLSYQERMLLSPGPETLQAETEGRIMIYDGLKNEMVEQALDSQFGRIENMMFVRTQYVQQDGEYEMEDDCD